MAFKTDPNTPDSRGPLTGQTHGGSPPVSPDLTSVTGWSARDGGILAFGDATFAGSTGNLHINAPIVGMARRFPRRRATGSWPPTAGIFASTPLLSASRATSSSNKRFVGMAPTQSGQGLSLVASETAGIFHSATQVPWLEGRPFKINKPDCLMAVSPTVGANGSSPPTGVLSLAFGNGAELFGSTGKSPWPSIVGIRSKTSNKGYWFVGRADGGNLRLRRATFTSQHHTGRRLAGQRDGATTPDGQGYWDKRARRPRGGAKLGRCRASAG